MRKDQWIQCTDRLPKSRGDVLLKFEKNLAVGFLLGKDWNVNTGNGFYTGLAKSEDQPIAWMPLFSSEPKEDISFFVCDRLKDVKEAIGELSISILNNETDRITDKQHREILRILSQYRNLLEDILKQA